MRAFGVLILAFLFAAPASAQVGLNIDVQSLVSEEFAADAPIMLEIARCESKYRQYTDAGNPLYGGYLGKMVGIFQVYSDIHLSGARAMGMDIETAEGNIAYARYLYDREGTRPWNSSISCWGSAVTKIATTTPMASTLPESVVGELTMDLSTGMDHQQVRILQLKLNAAGFRVSDSGPGSPGSETTLYGGMTRAAVQRFQCAKSIVCDGDGYSTGYGVFGPRTRSALLAHTGTSESAHTPVYEPQINSSSAQQTPPTASSESAEVIALRTQIAELQARIDELLAAR